VLADHFGAGLRGKTCTRRNRGASFPENAVLRAVVRRAADAEFFRGKPARSSSCPHGKIGVLWFATSFRLPQRGFVARDVLYVSAPTNASPGFRARGRPPPRRIGRVLRQHFIAPSTAQFLVSARVSISLIPGMHIFQVVVADCLLRQLLTTERVSRTTKPVHFRGGGLRVLVVHAIVSIWTAAWWRTGESRKDGE